MSYSFPEVKNFQGLFLQANSFTVPDGAMEVADNVVVKSDNIVSKRRGSYFYFKPSPTNMNQLFLYKNQLLAAYADKISYFTDTGASPNETGVETVLSGQTVAITGTRVSRGVEANNNLYLTSDNGILKLEDYNSNIYASGAPQGLDISVNISHTSIGPIQPNRSVGYRIIFGRRDANTNLIIGAPSNIATVFVPADVLTGNVNYTSAGAGPYTITVVSTAHGLRNGDEIIVSAGTSGNADGVHVITVVDLNTFTYSVSGNPGNGILKYTFTRQIRLEGSVPTDIASGLGWFYQVYRSSQATGNVTPSLDFKLIAERTLSTAEISNKVFFFNDDIDDILLGAELYTNPNSREGELQANYRAPKSEDITLYKNCVFYANCTTRQLLDLDVVDTSVIAGNDFIEVQASGVTRRYIAVSGVGNSTQGSQLVASNGGNLEVTYTAHGFVNGDLLYISNVASGSLAQGFYFVVNKAANTFQLSLTVGGSAIAFAGETSLDFQGVIHSIDTAGVSWSRTSSIVTVTSPSHNLTSGLTVQVTVSTGSPAVALQNYVITALDPNTFTFIDPVANSSGTLTYRVNSYMFQLDNTNTSISVQLRHSAQGIVKAMNRDPASLLYANYTSTTIPGEMRLQSKGFINTVFVRANTTLAGTGFLPVLPNSFLSGTQVNSADDIQKNVLFVSKLSEPEAVPLVNTFPVGARTKAILRIKALRDSVIIIKEDGIFRLTGDNPQNYVITVLDSTVICAAPSSVQLLNNEVILLSNQGVCRISESSVQIVSRRIDDVIQPIIGADVISTVTSAAAYESERIYLLTTIMPSTTSANVTYCYNVLNGSWTTWTSLMRQGTIGPKDSLYYIDLNGNLMKERKKQTRIDYCGQNTSVTITSVASDALSAVVNSPTLIESGDAIVKGDVFSRIASVSGSTPTFTVTFATQTNLLAADSVVSYKGIISQIKMAPFHAGSVGRMKQFAQMQLHVRDQNLSRCSISFTGYAFGGSPAVDWKTTAITANMGLLGGWGLSPWGFFPWGLADSINVGIGTKPANPIRIYVPLYQQRTTFIQPVIIHQEAGESINLQSLDFAVRPYGERISK